MNYGWTKYPDYWATLDAGHRLQVGRNALGGWNWHLTDIRDGADRKIIVETGTESSFKAAKDAAREAARYRGFRR